MMRRTWYWIAIGVLLLAGCGTPTESATTTESFGSGEEAAATSATGAETAATEAAAEMVATEAAETITPVIGEAVTAVAPAATDAGQATGAKQYSAPPAMVIDPAKTDTAVINTTKGSMTAELYAADAPKTVNNFVFLAREGFYNGIRFHRIIKDFMVQTGDPQGTGMGGPGYQFEDEPVTREYVRGTLAMANAGPNTNGSQFFIVHADYPLDKNYTIFGKVTEGLETLDAIANVPVSSDGGEASSPTEEVTITGITIEEQ